MADRITSFAEILLERDGDKPTGVFASGPSSIRRQVASICKTGLKENMHFESVSFSW
jgi:hypothetical protein